MTSELPLSVDKLERAQLRLLSGRHTLKPTADLRRAVLGMSGVWCRLSSGRASRKQRAEVSAVSIYCYMLGYVYSHPTTGPEIVYTDKAAARGMRLWQCHPASAEGAGVRRWLESVVKPGVGDLFEGIIRSCPGGPLKLERQDRQALLGVAFQWFVVGAMAE